MTDNDFTLIKPMETVHNIQALTPTQQQEERKRRQKRPQGSPETGGEPRKQTIQDPASDDRNGRHQIDYCA
ncbi:MAG: hypothetical protein KBI32_00350 [Phycisphaerae bacterium]|nr:hypothetical protein [Phycisphaerae bacterium]